MTAPENNEHEEPQPGDDRAARKKLYDALPDFWKGYVGVVDSGKDPKAGTYRGLASQYSQEFADLVWEKHERIKAEFEKHLREKESQTNDAN